MVSILVQPAAQLYASPSLKQATPLREIVERDVAPIDQAPAPMPVPARTSRLMVEPTTKNVAPVAVLIAVVVLLVGIGLGGSASATLVVEPDGVVLDTNTGFEWGQNANHGPFNWAGAVAYGNALALDGGGWHLASIGELQGLYNDLIAAGVCSGANCTGSIGGFTGIQPAYWSGTEIDSLDAWDFSFGSGIQGDFGKRGNLSAWAARPGDVDVAPAPEPATLALLGLGFAGLGFSRRKQ